MHFQHSGVDGFAFLETLSMTITTYLHIACKGSLVHIHKLTVTVLNARAYLIGDFSFMFLKTQNYAENCIWSLSSMITPKAS